MSHYLDTTSSDVSWFTVADLSFSLFWVYEFGIESGIALSLCLSHIETNKKKKKYIHTVNRFSQEESYKTEIVSDKKAGARRRNVVNSLSDT